MERITSILNRKEVHLHVVSPESLVTDAMEQMRSENIDYLVVLNHEQRFMGILTDHDVATKIIFGRKPLNNTRVVEVMNTRLPVVAIEETVEKCMRTMRQHNVRFLPVFDGFDFRGVVSADDIISEVVESRMQVFDPEEEQAYVFA